EVGRVHPAAPVGAEPGILGDFVTQVLPAAEAGREDGAQAALALPVVLRAERALENGLIAPIEVHGPAEGATNRPLDMRAQGARSRVDVHHPAGRGTLSTLLHHCSTPFLQ